MRNIIFILGFTLFIIYHSSAIAQNGWFALNSSTDINLNRIQFVNPQTGWAGGFQAIPTRYILIKTTNAGISWFNQSNNFPTGNRIISLYFVNSETGWVTGAEGCFKTTNGGNNFYITYGAVTNDCYFTDNLTGWIVCAPNSPPLLKTTNGGDNWNSQEVNIAQGSQLYSLHFENSNTGWAVGSSYIIKTTNGGTNWITQSNTIGNDNFQIYAISPDYSWVATMSGILSTTNGGTDWVLANIGSAHSVFFINSLTGYTVTGGQILKSTNGGVNWAQQFNGSGSFNDIFFTSTDTGYVCGTSGIIYKTITGGNTSVLQISSEIPPAYSLKQNYPNPFNPTTKIRFEFLLSKGGLKGVVSLKVYDILGKEIQTLVNEQLQPGKYEVTFDGSNLPSGVYFYKLTMGNYVETKKMILLK